MTQARPGACRPQIDPQELPLQRLYHWEATAPERIYFTQPYDGGKLRDYTWREVATQVRTLAAWLQAQGWPAGSRVSILGKNSAGWIMADLAIWMAGHVSVPLYPLLTADNIRQIALHSEAVACFVGKLDDESLLAGLPERMPLIALPLAGEAVRRRVSADFEGILASTAPLGGQPVRAGSDLATIVYTSGTTGQAKGVMHSFDTLSGALLSAKNAFEMSSDDRMFSYLPLAHIMERGAVELVSLHQGIRVYFAESLATFADDLRRARPTLFFSVPRLWLKFQQGVQAKIPEAKLQRLLSIPLVGHFLRRKILRGLGLDQVRFCGSGSAPLAGEVIAWYVRLGLPIYEGYGMTEVGCLSHGQRLGARRIGTVGPPTDGLDQRIDPASGEVQILTPGATLGYYKMPEQTAELFTADGWIRTGDKGTIDADRHLTLIGRIKDNFKTSKGKYVAPAPIEHKLGQHLAIDACLVAGSGLPQPIGLIVLNEVAVRSLPAARAQLEAEFAAHLDTINVTLDPHEQLDCLAIGTEPWTPDNGLLTPTLKVKRPQIEARFAARFEQWTARRQKVVWVE